MKLKRLMAALTFVAASEVKRRIADGSVGSPHVRVGHRQAPIPKPLVSDDRGFCFCARKKACFLFTLPNPSWHVLFRV
ncbi:hypothetical protein [Pseudomonas aeruginosa]